MMAGDGNRNHGASRRRKKKKAEYRAEKNMQARKKKQLKVSRGGCVARVLFLLLIVLGIYLFMQTPIFKLQQIEVRGISTITEDEIITLSGITIGENIFRVDRAQAEEQISLHALVADVQVKTRPLHTILIEVTERVGIGSFLFEGEYFTVDAEGYVIVKAVQIDENLPLFTGMELPESISVGMKLEGDAITDLIAIAGETKERYLGMQKEIKASEDGTYSLFLDRMEVKLGNGKNLIGKMSALDDILATLSADTKEKVEYIDVSAPQKPVVKEKAA